MIAKCVFGNSLATLRDRGGLVEPDRDDEVGVLAGGGRKVRDVGLRRRRLIDIAPDSELLLGPFQPLVGELVEAVIVQLVDVRDEHDEGLGAARSAGSAAACEGGDPGHEDDRDGDSHAVECTDLPVTCERTACRCDSLPFSWPRSRSDKRRRPRDPAGRPRRSRGGAPCARRGLHPRQRAGGDGDHATAHRRGSAGGDGDRGRAVRESRRLCTRNARQRPRRRSQSQLPVELVGDRASGLVSVLRAAFPVGAGVSILGGVDRAVAAADHDLVPPAAGHRARVGPERRHRAAVRLARALRRTGASGGRTARQRTGRTIASRGPRRSS